MSVVRRLLVGPAVLLALLLTVGWTASSAVAAPCPYVAACDPSIGVTSPNIQAGTTQQFVVNGFLPGEQVTLSFTDADGRVTVQTVIADADGRATGSFVVPADARGTVTLSARGAQSGASASTTFVVVAPSTAPTAPTGTPTTTAPGGGGGGGGGGGTGPTTSSGGGLAYTGVAVAGLGAVSVGLLVFGVVLLVAGRRRRPLAS